MFAALRSVEYYLPELMLSNQDLARECQDPDIERICAKVGIAERHVASPSECSSDLGLAAAQKLFDSGACAPDEIDYLLLCTQSPDYFLPTTACLLQRRLGMRTAVGALDFNLGCSGYVYGLGLAKGLIESGQASRVLLITAETYTKFLARNDRSVRTIFGDAAAATLIDASGTDSIGPFVFGTDGSGEADLIVSRGGMRHPIPSPGGGLDGATQAILYMNGPKVFEFANRVVPDAVEQLLTKAGLAMQDVDLFVFHQANDYMNQHLRRKLRIPEEKFCVALKQFGNTVSSTIPIALKSALDSGQLRAGALCLLVGFGVGFSWGATLVRFAG